ncbi:MAG TPA: hypothetical protein LFV90_01150 [Rickettsia endosymbiont of Columbicola hoogstraali]|nr:hypothetical protein [Rickettsia endosymbiont of Columbicola hoogstraali]
MSDKDEMQLSSLSQSIYILYSIYSTKAHYDFIKGSFGERSMIFLPHLYSTICIL